MKSLLILCLLAFSPFLVADDDVVGFWNTINDKTGKPQSIIAIYEYQGKMYGRIIGTFSSNGKVEDTIDAPVDRAPGVEGNPYYSGMDIIWDLKKKGTRYTDGKILDPEKGKLYDAEMWVQDGKLYVRGEIWLFGENEVWVRTQDSDLPPGFKKPDYTKFVPVIPKVKSDTHHESVKKG